MFDVLKGSVVLLNEYCVAPDVASLDLDVVAAVSGMSMAVDGIIGGE